MCNWSAAKKTWCCNTSCFCNETCCCTPRCLSQCCRSSVFTHSVLVIVSSDKCSTHQRYKYDMPNAQLMNFQNISSLELFYSSLACTSTHEQYKYEMINVQVINDTNTTCQLINDKNTTCQMPNSWTSKIFHRSNSFIRHLPAQVLMNNTKDKCPTHQRYKYDMPNAQLMNVSNAQLMNSFSRHWLAQSDVISTGNGSM